MLSLCVFIPPNFSKKIDKEQEHDKNNKIKELRLKEITFQNHVIPDSSPHIAISKLFSNKCCLLRRPSFALIALQTKFVAQHKDICNSASLKGFAFSAQQKCSEKVAIAYLFRRGQAMGRKLLCARQHVPFTLKLLKDTTSRFSERAGLY